MSRFFVVLVFVCIHLTSFAEDNRSLDFEHTIRFQQAAVSHFMHDADPMISDSANIKSRSLAIKENLLASLKYALEGSYLFSELMIGLANIYILLDEMDRAKVVFNKLSFAMPHSPIVQTFITAYALIWDKNAFDENVKKLASYKNWKYTDHFLETIKLVQNSFNTKINMPEKNHFDFKALFPKIDQSTSSLVIVVLGYKLNADGSMDLTLVNRLKSAKSAIDYYENASIIVTGGQPAGGVTESYQMKQWLIHHGVPSNRVIMDDKATDTVWNAIYSIKIIRTLLADKNINHILLVSSDYHIRRASADYIQALANYGMQSQITVHNIAALDTKYDENKIASKREQALIIRDILRTAGLWAIPGMVH